MLGLGLGLALGLKSGRCYSIANRSIFSKLKKYIKCSILQRSEVFDVVTI